MLYIVFADSVGWPGLRGRVLQFATRGKCTLIRIDDQPPALWAHGPIQAYQPNSLHEDPTFSIHSLAHTGSPCLLHWHDYIATCAGARVLNVCTFIMSCLRPRHIQHPLYYCTFIWGTSNISVWGRTAKGYWASLTWTINIEETMVLHSKTKFGGYCRWFSACTKLWSHLIVEDSASSLWGLVTKMNMETTV